MNRKIVPDVISGAQDIETAKAGMTVRDVALTMTKRRIGAVIVVDDAGKLAGIFTERDVLTKVVAGKRDPDATLLADVMTRNPDTIGPEESATEALDMMRRHGYRHLPVVDGGRLIGVVSVRDLYATILGELEEGLQERDAFITGSAGYGLT
jgi:CBS domain-containing protein